MNGGNRKVQYWAALAVCLSNVTSGVIFSWMTPVIPKFHDNETGINLTDTEISWVTAMSSPGAIAGSVATRYLADKYGRRATVIGSALPMAVGMVMVACATNAWMLYVTRFAWGAGSGMITVVGSIYLAEISDKEIRGSLTVATRFMFNLGSFLVMSIGPFVSYDTLIYMMLVLPVLCFLACWWIPESPYYLLREGRVDDAREAMLRIRGYKDEKVLEDELLLLESDVKRETRRSGSIKELFTGKQYRRALIIVAGLKMTQQLSGSFAIPHYLGPIIQESHSTILLSTAFIVFGVLRFLSGIASSILADKIGRRPLLIYSYMGTALSLFAIGVYFFLQDVIRIDPASLYSYNCVVYIALIVFGVISTVGFLSLVFIIPAELFPMNVKSLAMTCATIYGGLLNFSITKAYQSIKDLAGLYGAFWIFAFIALLGAIFSFVVVPETGGKSLREIQMLLQGNTYDEANEKLNPVIEANGNAGKSESKELTTI